MYNLKSWNIYLLDLDANYLVETIFFCVKKWKIDKIDCGFFQVQKTKTNTIEIHELRFNKYYVV